MANEQAKAFIDQATQSLQNSQFQQALDLVDQAIAIEGNVSDAHVLRGICLSQLGQPDAATEAFRKAIMLSPYNAKAYYNLAVHQNSLGNKKEAWELAREAVNVDPRHAAAKQLFIQLDGELVGPVHSPPGTMPDVLHTEEPMKPQSHSAGAQDLPGQPMQDVHHMGHAQPSQPGHPSPTPDRPGQAGPSSPAAPSAQRPPAASPYAASGGSPYSPGGYQRTGYNLEAHSLPWVENMGSGWVTIGWVLAALAFLLLGAEVLTSMGQLQQVFANAQAGHASPQFMGSPLGLMELFMRVMCLVWMFIDVIDRRSGWGWVVALVIGCCCCAPWVVVPLYILFGRK